ncbi:MAG: hypothetical protein JWO38_5079 [Gemmataceae bacterium]|nr:hypothetical protein [Gemmataceae bacterium]
MKLRRLKLMADYHCNPLWGYSDPPDDLYANPDPADLPLSEATVRELRAWAAWYDTFIHMADPYDSREVLPEESAAFNQVGRRLWAAVRLELGSGWVVNYFEGGKLVPPPSPDAEPGAAPDTGRG